MRRLKVVPELDINTVIPASVTRHFNNNLWWLLLSIVPGLGHSAQGRFNEIRWYFWAWLVLFLLCLFFYGSSAGYILLGVAIGIHVSIALQSGIIKSFDDLKNKIAMCVSLLVILALIYGFTPRILIEGGPAGLTIPYHNVEIGDYLIGWRHFYRTTLLPRGALVLIHPGYFSYHNPNDVHESRRSNEVVFAEIVGVGGERLQIENNTFLINGQKLDTEKYPVPKWLRDRYLSVIIPDGSYFLNVLYDVNAHGLELNNPVILRVCLVESGDIEAKAFLCWWPLSRRGFIKVN
jgi:hypothetical protein